jgi:hypothetical protein
MLRWTSKIVWALMLAQLLAGTAFSEVRPLGEQRSGQSPWVLDGTGTPGFFTTPVGGNYPPVAGKEAPIETVGAVPGAGSVPGAGTVPGAGATVGAGTVGGGGSLWGGGIGGWGLDLERFSPRRHLNFSVEVQEELNDNIFQTPGKGESDSILHVNPTISYNLVEFIPAFLRRQEHFPIGLSWSLNLNSSFYMKHKELNDINWSGGTGFAPGFQFDYSPWDRAKIHYSISTENVPVSEINSEATNQQKRQIINSVVQNATLDLTLGPRQGLWLLHYGHTDTFYVQKDYQSAGNSMDDIFSVTRQFGTSTKTPYIGSSFESTRYPDGGRNNTGIWLGYAGLKGQLGPKLSGDIRAGASYSMANQSNGSNEAISSGGNNGTTSFYTQISLHYIMTNRITMDLELGQQPQPSQDIQQNYAIVDTASFTVNYLPPFFNKRATFSAGITYTRDRYGYSGALSNVENNSSVTEGSGAPGTFQGTYEVTSTFSYRANKWLTLSAEYEYLTQSSNGTNADFTNNIFYLSATGGF